MEETSPASVLDGEIVGIRFCLASPKEIVSINLSLFIICSLTWFVVAIIFSLDLLWFGWLQHMIFGWSTYFNAPAPSSSYFDSYRWVISCIHLCLLEVVLTSALGKRNNSATVFFFFFLNGNFLLKAHQAKHRFKNSPNVA